MTDNLFDLPDATPDRLALARLALERAELDMDAAERADEEMPLGTHKERDAVAAARYELHLAELERMRP